MPPIIEVQALSKHFQVPEREKGLKAAAKSLVKMLFSRFTVRFNDHSLNATAWGEAIEVARHQPAVEVKGATYTQLSVKRDEQGHWIAQCVVDV